MAVVVCERAYAFGEGRERERERVEQENERGQVEAMEGAEGVRNA